MDSRDKELSLSLFSDRNIQKLNRQYRGIDAPTDVLAFPMLEGDLAPLNANLLGDVIISIETATRQAEQFGHSLEEELFILIIHGVLHLLGYDHGRSDKMEKRMRLKEEELLEIVKKEMNY